MFSRQTRKRPGLKTGPVHKSSKMLAGREQVPLKRPLHIDAGEKCIIRNLVIISRDEIIDQKVGFEILAAAVGSNTAEHLPPEVVVG